MTRHSQVLYQRQVAAKVWNLINQEVNRHARCTHPIVKLMLLLHDSNFNMLFGRQVYFKHKSLGAGVYDVWMEYVEKGGGHESTTCVSRSR